MKADRQKEAIAAVLNRRENRFLALFDTLGYPTDRGFETEDPGEFIEEFGLDLRPDRALVSDWVRVDGLFQLVDEEIDPVGHFRTLDRHYLQSYLFVGLTLRKREYTRSQLAGIVRELNKTSDIPIFVLFGYGDLLTFAVVDRRPSKQKGQSDRDVLEKVTLVKDIRTRQPHRAHLDILFDLSLPQVLKRGKVTNFDELHAAWKLVLDTSELNRRFFNELSDWYFWAVDRVEFPDGAEADRDRRNKTSLIRLISRLMFVWFLREKHLVDPALFDRAEVEKLLKSLDPDDSSYYEKRTRA